FAPPAARSTATDLPMPEPPPVTSATFPSNLAIGLPLPLVCVFAATLGTGSDSRLNVGAPPAGSLPVGINRAAVGSAASQVFQRVPDDLRVSVQQQTFALNSVVVEAGPTVTAVTRDDVEVEVEDSLKRSLPV